MPNLLTPMDMLGGLIDPRDEEETLTRFKERLSEAAEGMLNRDLSPQEDSWRAAREQELEGRLGESVSLIAAEEDEQLRKKAEGRLLTYDNLTERERSFRWPRFEPQGEQPRFGYGTVGSDGVAQPEALQLQNEGVLKASPGYVVSEGRLFYVPAQMKTTTFRLPAGTETTVVPPWHVESAHAHRFEVIDDQSLRLIGADGHEHEVRRDGTQQGYDEAGSGRSSHTHTATPIDASGPAFAQTRPYNPSTEEKRDTGTVTLTAKDKVSPAPNRPFQVPDLDAKTVQTDSDNTGHSHKVTVSPHDYWSGTFALPGTDHNHRVEDWVVTTNMGHTHTITKPTIPSERALVPRLVSYEGDRLKPQIQSPYALNMNMNEGWVEASCPEGFSEMLVIGFETGGRLDVPPPEPREGTVGLGPTAGPDHFYLETRRKRVGSDLVIAARVEDAHTGGVPHQKVTARWDLSASTPPSVDHYTDEDGVALVRVPTDPNQTSYTVELSADGLTRTETYKLNSFGEPGGYGIDYGIDYGS